MCFARFESMVVLNGHIKSAHRHSVSWTCGRLHKEVEQAYAFAFDSLVSYNHPGEGNTRVKSIMCGFCGKHSFSPTCSKLLLAKHLKRLHRNDKCDHSIKFYNIHVFREHLEQSHGALPGSWMMIIEAACRTSELFIPISAASRQAANVQRRAPSTQNVGEGTSSGLEMIEIQEMLDRSNLLGHWSGTRDRINRWLLHSLISDEGYAELHRSQMPEPDLDQPKWMRLLLRYWFMDEAATGVEIAYSLSGGAVDSRTGSSLVSSGPSEYHTCVKESGIGDAMIQGQTNMSSLHPNERPQSVPGQSNSKVSSSTQKKHKCETCDNRFTRPSSSQTHPYTHDRGESHRCDKTGGTKTHWWSPTCNAIRGCRRAIAIAPLIQITSLLRDHGAPMELS